MAASPETPPANSSSPPSFSDLIPPSPPDKPGPSPPQESPPPPAESSPPPSPPSSPPPAQSKSPPPSPPASTPSPPVSSPPTASSSPPPPSSPADSNNGTGSSSPPSPPPPPSSFVSPPLPANELAPPPPPPHKAPPSHRSSVSSPSSSPSSGSSLSPSQKYTILGVVAGAGLLLLLVVVALTVACTRKKKKKKPPTNYYMDPQVSRAGEYYYNGNNSQRTPPHWGNTGSLGPSHGTMATPQHQHAGWPQQTPLPTINSGEMSGSFSSPYSAGRPPPQPTLSIGLNKSTFSYEELAAATDDFAQENILGQGGFGYVLKGVLPNGKEVAVKCLRQGSGQGDREFQAEVEIISRVHHRHLVSLVGYCIAGEQRMLVYEFLPNKTLEHHLHGKDPPPMDWPTRLKIAIGMAKGIAYLHEDCHPRIIHRDIKAANILLDMNFEAKVADFGLAKLSSDNFTHVSTRIMGTFGYLAPEYAASGKLTEKSDVFSFGVMLLELITGRKPVDTTGQYADMDESLVDWARPLITQALEDGNCSTLADPTLGGIYNPHEMARMIACAGACVRHSARRRPKMSQVVHALEGDASLDDLHDWTKPGSTSSAMGSGSSEENNSGSYTEDMKKFRKMAFQNHDYASSEFGATSEYGLNPSSSSSSDSREVSSMATSRRNIR